MKLAMVQCPAFGVETPSLAIGYLYAFLKQDDYDILHVHGVALATTFLKVDGELNSLYFSKRIEEYLLLHIPFPVYLNLWRTWQGPIHLYLRYLNPALVSG